MIKKLLIVEDDNLTSYLMKKLIKKNAVAEEVVVKENGYEALDYLKHLPASDFFPNVIIIDIDMPVMDGYEFVANYEKQFWRDNSNTYLLMATSSKRKIDYERSIKNPCVNECVFKPITKDILLQLSQNLHSGK